MKLRRVGDWRQGRSGEVRLAMRTTLAGLITFTLAHLLELPQAYWAVLTSVIIMQESVGGSLKAGLDRMLGTVPSLALAASIVGDGIGGRPGQQDRIGREIDPLCPVGGVEDQALLVGRARRGDAGNFQTPQLDQGPTLRPQGGDVVRRVVCLCQLQEQPERHRAGPQPAFHLLA